MKKIASNNMRIGSLALSSREEDAAYGLLAL